MDDHEFCWRSTDSVGEPELDAQHRNLCTLAQALLGALRADSQGDAARNLLDDLMEATLAHFEFEERLLEESNYPGLLEHQAGHNRLLRTILQFRFDLRHRRYRPEVAGKFIQAWVLDHVRKDDARYVGKLSASGKPSDAAD